VNVWNIASEGGISVRESVQRKVDAFILDKLLGDANMKNYFIPKLVTFDAPSAVNDTFGGLGRALNLEGSFAGTYADANYGVRGFVRFADGKLILANAPVAGQQSTVACAINDLNAFTGYWFDANGAEHGFVALAVP
jgi:hypothetical protein